MEYEEVLSKLQVLTNPKNIAGMARFGINPEGNLGVSLSELRSIAKELGTDHELALRLWSSGIRDARILASIIDNPKVVSEQQMEHWVKDLNSWDVCDACCSNLFDKTPFAYQKAVEWSTRNEEFVKRAGFVLMAALAVHDKYAPDTTFTQFLPIIKREAYDNRTYVKKAVNWALRQIGKRNLQLHARAIQTAQEIHQFDSQTARWIAADALRELHREKILVRLRQRANNTASTKVYK